MHLVKNEVDYRRPRFIPELGEEGLDSRDIAAALGVRTPPRRREAPAHRHFRMEVNGLEFSRRYG